MAQHNELGKKGEEDAVGFLKANGYEILAQNYRYGKGEIDIICKKNKLTIFCEVKTRSSDYFGTPEESVTSKKIRLIKRTAEKYLFQNKIETEVRFDIVSIVSNQNILKIYHLKDAFFQDADDADSIYQ